MIDEVDLGQAAFSSKLLKTGIDFATAVVTYLHNDVKSNIKHSIEYNDAKKIRCKITWHIHQSIYRPDKKSKILLRLNDSIFHSIFNLTRNRVKNRVVWSPFRASRVALSEV